MEHSTINNNNNNNNNPSNNSNSTQTSSSSSSLGDDDRISNASVETTITGNNLNNILLPINYSATTATTTATATTTTATTTNNSIILNSANNNNSNNRVFSSSSSSSLQISSHHQVLIRNSSTSPSATSRKIMAKNHNNTTFLTSFPNNLAELQLYRVMQNASLLLYYDTLLGMGGDDVQQLCDACEDEFLEIMSLVGMASKPLHVRRLQKSLQEWVTNPMKFKIPLVPGEDFEIELSSPRVTSNHIFYSAADSGENSRSMYSPSPAELCALPPVVSPNNLNINNKRPYSPLSTSDPNNCPPSSCSSPGGTTTPSSSSSLLLVNSSPNLMENQIAKIAAAAERLSKKLPNLEKKPLNTKRKICKELELVMSMPENDPRRMDEIRRYAAIYGRFDCKRKPEKPLTLHEVSVNEAAAQICRFVPALLTRRDELFPLARQVVKDSGCYYSKTQLSAVYMNKSANLGSTLLMSGSTGEREPSSGLLDQSGGKNQSNISTNSADNHHHHHHHHQQKRIKIEPNSDNDELQQRQDYEESLLTSHQQHQSLHSIFDKNDHQALIREAHLQRTSLGVELDESDSQFTYSNSSSPQFQGHDQDSSTITTAGDKKNEEIEENDEENINKFSPKVQIIAASGDNIIAVANPALALSSALIPISHSSSSSSTSLRRNDKEN